jgi:hypothetical protein
MALPPPPPLLRLITKAQRWAPAGAAVPAAAAAAAAVAPRWQQALLCPRLCHCRYGSGLVVYWFGHLGDLANDPEVMILDRCPAAAEVRVLPQLQLEPDA